MPTPGTYGIMCPMFGQHQWVVDPDTGKPLEFSRGQAERLATDWNVKFNQEHPNAEPSPFWIEVHQESYPEVETY